MPAHQNPYRKRLQRMAVLLVAATTGVAAALLAGIAIAKSFTLQVAKDAPVTDVQGVTTHENIVISSHGSALYTLNGDSKHHPKCTKANGCFPIWPPMKVRSAKSLSKSTGIHGRLGTWRRNGFLQVTLAGHPLYRFSQDRSKRAATGEGINAFGGIWHVAKASGNPASGSMSGPTSTVPYTTTSTTGTTTTMPYPY